jgi:hypothetical protein
MKNPKNKISSNFSTEYLPKNKQLTLFSYNVCIMYV